LAVPPSPTPADRPLLDDLDVVVDAPEVGQVSLTWEECLSLSTSDWKIFRRACHDALVLARTRRWTSNVLL
jgi:hypothetical protein